MTRSSPVAVQQRIRGLLATRGLTWKAVAGKAGVNESWLYHLGRPKRSLALDIVEAIAETLAVHPAELLYPDWTEGRRG